MAGGPLDGHALLLAAAKASIPGERLPDLVDRLQIRLAPRQQEYARRYECAHEDATHAVYFVERGHWETLGSEFDLERREWHALRRAHEEHLKRLGTEFSRRAEFEAALELREVVAIGKATQ